ncbi:tautomerase family protein [Kaistella rhinocerotis]|uniref:tautomerase family protein n=1 Tax=Kaistella rhinocerotis TaxID=3026437 RepID=UPI002556EE6D|nr:tautomerase family protein [Kaistella sp. Ran72]
MPAILIEVRKDYSETEGNQLIDAVHTAMVTAFQIPPEDKTVRLLVHPPHRFAVSPTKTQPELYTMISIDAFAGRSIDAKRKLFSEIAGNLFALGIPKDHILIVVRDSMKESWGVQGGQSGYDVNLGFKVEV